MDSRWKNCPLCGCEIPAIATRCRHCHEWITPEALAEREERKAREAREIEKAEQERRALEEQARAEAERLRRAAEERARAEAERAEQARLAAEAEQARLAAERAERERLEAEEQARAEAEKAEQERLEAEAVVSLEDATLFDFPEASAEQMPPPVPSFQSSGPSVPPLPPQGMGPVPRPSATPTPPASTYARKSHTGLWVLLAFLLIGIAAFVFYAIDRSNSGRRYENVEMQDFSDASSDVSSHEAMPAPVVEEIPAAEAPAAEAPQEAVSQDVYYDDEDYSDEGNYW